MNKPKDPVKRYWPKVQVKGPNECWPWIAARDLKGYGCFNWNGKNNHAHRFAWILQYGQIPVGLHCLHRCDNPACQNFRHLFLGTNDDNIADKMKKGRHRGARGEHSGSAKLRAEQVMSIRWEWEYEHTPQAILAKKYGVHEGHISMIVTGKTWKHLLPESQVGAGLVKQAMKNYRALCRESFKSRYGIRSLKVVRRNLKWKKA